MFLLPLGVGVDVVVAEVPVADRRPVLLDDPAQVLRGHAFQAFVFKLKQQLRLARVPLGHARSHSPVQQ